MSPRVRKMSKQKLQPVRYPFQSLRVPAMMVIYRFRRVRAHCAPAWLTQRLRTMI